MTLSDAVGKGRREGLVALRDLLAAQMDSSGDVRSLAALAKQLTDVLRELDSIPTGAEVTPVDEVAAARAARRAAAQAV